MRLMRSPGPAIAAITAAVQSCAPQMAHAADPDACVEPVHLRKGERATCTATQVPLDDILSYERTELLYDNCLDFLAEEKTGREGDRKGCEDRWQVEHAARLKCEDAVVPTCPPPPEPPEWYETGEFWAVTVGVLAVAGGFYLGWTLRGDQ